MTTLQAALFLVRTILIGAAVLGAAIAIGHALSWLISYIGLWGFMAILGTLYAAGEWWDYNRTLKKEKRP